MSKRYLGIDVGAESIKLVFLEENNNTLSIASKESYEHGKNPQHVLQTLYQKYGIEHFDAVAITGRFSKQFTATRIPVQQAQSRGFKHLYPNTTGTLISIGSHGFSVLELRDNGREIFRENSRCSQGTGNFLRQLVGRFSMSIEEASVVTADISNAASLSGRCPVILKTDMTHLANKGEHKVEILAGLFDAVCENVLNLVKPGISPNPVVLIGGVSQSKRIQQTCQKKLKAFGFDFIYDPELAIYFEALGAALIAKEDALKPPKFDNLLASEEEHDLEKTPRLSSYMHQVKRMPAPLITTSKSGKVVIGLDIGSTGAKAVAIDVETKEQVWDAYIQTLGAPVESAQALLKTFLESTAGKNHVLGVATTGSGREIVGSLLSNCYSSDDVFVQNEIAAHAAGAAHYDQRVDTIFEIGGQDAKYIRLDGGRVIDCAMNEACSAGTGSFIEEQGSKFHGISHISDLGKAALEASEGISLGQHCSVFMAEIIDEAVSMGIAQNTIIAGLYDSIIQNYLNRVKGSRSVGEFIFCQGMPFASDALAAAVARQTNAQVIIPPNPGTVGALGIALLALESMDMSKTDFLDLNRFFEAKVDERTTFVCNSTVGCGAPGNKCKIDRLKTTVAGQTSSFIWGGACSLYEKGSKKKKLPNLAPQPFQEREQLVSDLLSGLKTYENSPFIALSDEFMLKDQFPFFATFLSHLGLNLTVLKGNKQATLKRGIQEGHVPFCAPMQLFRGVAGELSETDAKYIFTPIFKDTQRSGDEEAAKVCPVVQGAPQMLKLDYEKAGKIWITTEIEVGEEGIQSAKFKKSCRLIAQSLDTLNTFEEAFKKAVLAQEKFLSDCINIGHQALAFCEAHDITPVVVLGRPYTIYNPILNSNVPAILREQGAISIPVDCYPIASQTPLLDRIYWGYAQKILQVAHQVRREEGTYSVYCSNYSCGPDSFNLHFYGYVMEGKPFAIIETDGHAGDAGTKTRIEAFLHCVHQDQAATKERPKEPSDFKNTEKSMMTFDTVDKETTLLVPWMGISSNIVTSCLQAAGYKAETLEMPDRYALKLGRRYTSGKECVPVSLTLGRLLQKLESEKDRKFAYIMPRTTGPCRMGMYHLLQKIVIEKIGESKRCAFISPTTDDYFEALPKGFPVLFLAGVIAQDMLHNALLYVRPSELVKGESDKVYERYSKELYALIANQTVAIDSKLMITMHILSGTLFGMASLLRRASEEFAKLNTNEELPIALLVGEIYVRNDAFANDNIISKLEARGLRVSCSENNEWFEYVDYDNQLQRGEPSYMEKIVGFLRKKIHHIAYDAIASKLPLNKPPKTQDIVEASKEYICGDIGGETVLTMGRSIYDWRKGLISAVVNVGPLECMPMRIAESQFFHAAEKEGLPTLTLPFNGDPISDDTIDNFAFEIHSRFKKSRLKAV